MEKYVLNAAGRQKLMEVAEIAVEHFNSSDWHALGMHTGQLNAITSHDRLLRSLNFNDDDYEGHVYAVLTYIAEADRENLRIIERFILKRYGDKGSISTAPGHGTAITLKPSVFEVPKDPPERDLIAVMTPFAPQFEPVFDTIQRAATASGFKAQRAKDIWEHSAVIQDVFIRAAEEAAASDRRCGPCSN